MRQGWVSLELTTDQMRLLLDALHDEHGYWRDDYAPGELDELIEYLEGALMHEVSK